ncbi:MAG: glycoside hydrolase family 3 protein [Oscillospiraceae bacterium]|jgi:beta-glucosidase|nr:glycoside hydrolase family 3 protein [Oscillospiraceae bacterium]
MTKRLSLLLALFLLLSACSGVSPTPSADSVTPDAPPVEETTPAETPETPETSPSPEEPDLSYGSMEELLALMTLDEKIGQMTQAERIDLQGGDIKRFYLGSVLSGGGSVPATNTAAGWSKMTDDFMRQSLDTRLGIPLIYGIDAVHGHNNVMNATIFPHNVGLGAIGVGDIKSGAVIAQEIGAATAEEMLATGIPWTFSPVLGVAEDIRWGRAYECFGENVDLVTAISSAVIAGLQSSGKVAACMKHYLGEGQTVNGQNQGNAIMDDEDIRRILPPYIEAIKGGALTLMPSFSSVNGLKMHESKELLTDLLKDELGFEGFVISDWAAITQLTGGSYQNQIANAINAGVDMVMATNGRNWWVDYIKYLKAAVLNGDVPMERIDDAVLRILKVKEKLGLFENPNVSTGGDVGTEEHRALAREAAARSMTLLKNENDIIARLKDFDNILLAGEGGSDIGMQCGGWSITWQGSHGAITEGTTILEGLQAVKDNVTYAKDGVAEGEFDCAIVVVGENPYAEYEGDRSGNVTLRTQDVAALNAVYELGCPVIVVMLTGRPMMVSTHLENWDALISAWLPGSEGGGALADVLFGDAEFTGRTPFTWTVTQGGDTLYEYGYGLS